MGGGGGGGGTGEKGTLHFRVCPECDVSGLCRPLSLPFFFSSEDQQPQILYPHLVLKLFQLTDVRVYVCVRACVCIVRACACVRACQCVRARCAGVLACVCVLCNVRMRVYMSHQCMCVR